MMRIDLRHRRVFAFAAMAGAFVVVAVGLQLVGLSGRHYLPQQVRYEVGDATEGYNRLVATGVRGRILVLFDRTSRLEPYGEVETMSAIRRQDLGGITVAPNELVDELIARTVVREVWVVFPDSEWIRVETFTPGFSKTPEPSR